MAKSRVPRYLPYICAKKCTRIGCIFSYGYWYIKALYRYIKGGYWYALRPALRLRRFCASFSQFSRRVPSILTVITCQGINFPLFCSAVLAANSSPPQQGTSIRTMVRERMSLREMISVSFSV